MAFAIKLHWQKRGTISELIISHNSTHILNYSIESGRENVNQKDFKVLGKNFKSN